MWTHLALSIPRRTLFATLFATLLATLLVAGACTTTYQRASAPGHQGYTETKVGPDAYLISFTATTITMSGTLASYISRRGHELCGGPFDLTDYNFVTGKYGNSASGKVTCQHAGAAPANVARQPAAVQAGTQSGACYGNGTCNAGLACSGGICQRAQTGTNGGSCYGNNTCNADLTCADGRCRPAP